MRNYLYRVTHQTPGRDVQSWEGAAVDCYDALKSASQVFGLPALDIDAPNVQVEFVKELGKKEER